jgi:thiamine monophosphate synthase
MRKSEDNRPDWQVKAEMWEEICKKYYIQFMVDDRNQVVDYARNLGFKVLQTEYNNF